MSLAWCQNSPRGYEDVLIGFNSFQSNTTLQIDNNPDCTFDDVRVVGNLMSYDGGCQARWAFRYNVWSTAYRTGSCHPTDEIQGPSFPYADGGGSASMDYRLVEPGAGIGSSRERRLSADGHRRPAAAAHRSLQRRGLRAPTPER